MIGVLRYGAVIFVAFISIPTLYFYFHFFVASRNELGFIKVRSTTRSSVFLNVTKMSVNITKATLLWKSVDLKIKAGALYSRRDNIDVILEAMKRERIVRVTDFKVKTSFKLLLTLSGGKRIIFKPRLIPQDLRRVCSTNCEIPEAEVVAFNIDRLLGYRRAPYAVMRTVDIAEEILPVADEEMDIFYKNGSTYCTRFKCLRIQPRNYCFPGGVMVGAMIYWIERSIKEQRPTGRMHLPFSYEGNTNRRNKTYRDIYREMIVAPGTNEEYCQLVRRTMHPYQIPKYFMDLVDMAVLNFLVLNDDRKHYIVRGSDGEHIMTIHIDHGLGMCQYTQDRFRLIALAPVRLCCRIRRSTQAALKKLRHSLAKKFLRVSRINQDYLVVTRKHLDEMAERIGEILDTVDKCHKTVGEEVFVDF